MHFYSIYLFILTNIREAFALNWATCVGFLVRQDNYLDESLMILTRLSSHCCSSII